MNSLNQHNITLLHEIVIIFILSENMNKTGKLSPRVKDILELLGKGILLSSLFIFPGAGLGIKAIYDFYEEANKTKELKEWNKYSRSRLKFILKRLHDQKLIQISEDDKYSIVKLTEKGNLRVLKYKLEEMIIQKPQKWDGRWRMVIYDIKKFKRKEQEAIRRILNRLKFLQLQKSVYLTPYPCEKEITFLREYFGVGTEVLYIIVYKIENEEVYKNYFGI